MRLKILILTTFVALFALPAWSVPTMIVGDSLSKEYAVEGILLWDNAQARKARNWMEMLLALRSSHFSFGSNGTYIDARGTGHAYNWSVPGYTTADWEDLLVANSLFQQYQRSIINNQLQNSVDRVVIFLGGNDVNQVYQTYYNGADPTSFIDSVVSRFQYIVDEVKGENPGLEIVLVAVPDVGATPDVQADHPDPAKRALVTQLTANLNASLAAMAETEGLGFADIFAFTQLYISPETVSIGGVPMIKGYQDQNGPRYLFSQDAFHPNTSAQAFIANEIIRAFNAKFGAGIPQLSGAEIIAYLESQHGQQIDIPFSTWIAAYGVTDTTPQGDPDGDGVRSDIEFALGLDPSRPDADQLPRARLVQIGGVTSLALTYEPRADFGDYTTIEPMGSYDLEVWFGLGAGSVTNNGDGTWTAQIPANTPAGFLTLEIGLNGL